MRLPVGRIVELVGQEVEFRMLAGHGIGLFNGAVGCPSGRRQDYFRSIGLHDLSAFNGGRLRHDQLTAVSFGGTDHGQADTGITAGRLKKHLVARQFAAFLACLYHGQGNSVLDGSTGIF